MSTETNSFYEQPNRLTVYGKQHVFRAAHSGCDTHSLGLGQIEGAKRFHLRCFTRASFRRRLARAGFVRMKCAAAACYAFLNVPSLEPQPEMLFYDGHCALCQHSVKFVLKHDRSGKLFRFAPLQGPTFEARVAAEKRAGLPDSVVVLTNEGAVLVRSDAFLHVLRRLGGGWRALAACDRPDSADVARRGLRFHRPRALSRLRHARRFVPGNGSGFARALRSVELSFR